MRAQMLLPSAIAVALIAPLSPAAAQIASADSDARAMLGIEVSMSGTARDTLGVLVSSVVSGSPADRAGIRERDRIAEVNGMSLRVSREDVGRTEARELVHRRLTRELGALRSGDAVTMRVFAGGRSRIVTIRVEESEEVDSRANPQGSTLLDVISSLRETQTRLHELVANERAGAVRDTLAQAELEIAELQRRLQLAEVQRRRRTERGRRTDEDEGRIEDAGESLRGLRVTIVSDELEPYFGEGSARGLLVLEADESWAPIRTGDVIVRVDGAPATKESLRDALDSRRGTEVELLRRRRSLIVTLGGRR
jgi:S1-C subfamily serine protease